MTSNFTLADNSSKPYAWMLEGVEVQNISNVSDYVEDYARTSINATNSSEMDDSAVYADWRDSGEFEAAVAYIQGKKDEWVTEYNRINNLTIVEKLAELEYTPAEITERTYIYIDTDGKLAGIEKHSRSSQPIDELDAGEYVAAYDGGIEAVKRELSEYLAISEVITAAEAAEVYGLSESAVRQAINRHNITARKSGGTWLILRREAEKRWKI